MGDDFPWRLLEKQNLGALQRTPASLHVCTGTDCTVDPLALRSVRGFGVSFKTNLNLKRAKKGRLFLASEATVIGERE